jgi:uncharacterized spore protein YtfJ
MRELADRIEQAANVKAVFGERVVQGTETIIPVARVSVRGGAGAGSGERPDSRDEASPGRGRGIGVGLNVVSSPVGYIKSTSEGPLFVPIVDRNRVLLAGAVLAGIGLLAITKGFRAARK